MILPVLDFTIFFTDYTFMASYFTKAESVK